MIAVLAIAFVVAAPEFTVSHRRVDTADGAALALYRYQSRAESSLPPVLLVPDLGFSRAAYDFEGRGLARTLASLGRTVYVAELRGQGKSSRATSLEAMGRIDFPRVLEVIGAKRVDLVVQGWVGSLVLASNVGDPRIRHVVALNTPLLAEPPSRLAEQFLIDGGRFSSLSSNPDGAREFELLFSMWSRFPTGTQQAFLSTGTRDLSPEVAAELLAWMRTGDLPLAQGALVERLSTWRTPTLLLLGLADGFSPPEQCAVWRERTPSVRLRTFSRVETKEDFSHLSMLLGTHAPSVVFPLIVEFLEQP